MTLQDVKKSGPIRHLFAGDELVLAINDVRAAAKHFHGGDNVIFIHGFTAHGEYLETMANQFNDNGFNSFLFNYNSYKGVMPAAISLMDKLDDINALGDDCLKNNKLSLVCHSMGGLVARAFLTLPNSQDYIRSVVTLGTPHDGTLINDSVLECFIYWGESITAAMPGFTRKSFNSARELIKLDASSQEDTTIEVLKNASSDEIINLPFLSVSGGKRYLEVGNKLLSAVINRRLQGILGGQDNDGLVMESSSDSSKVLIAHKNAKHLNNYPEYLQISHTYLTQNQTISLKVMRWLKEKNSGN